MMDSIPEPIQQALWAGIAAAVAALFAVVIKAINAWGNKFAAQAATERSYLGDEQAKAAVTAVDQTMPDAPNPDKLSAAVKLAPAATLAQIEAAVKARKGADCNGPA